MSLKNRLKEAEISYQDIAKWLGKKYDTIVKAINRESFSDLEIKEVARRKGILSDWLATGEGEMLPTGDTLKKVAIEKYNHEAAVRMQLMIKEYFPKEMMDLWEKQLTEILDLCEYKEFYINAKDYYLGKKK